MMSISNNTWVASWQTYPTLPSEPWTLSHKNSLANMVICLILHLISVFYKTKASNFFSKTKSFMRSLKRITKVNRKRALVICWKTLLGVARTNGVCGSKSIKSMTSSNPPVILKSGWVNLSSKALRKLILPVKKKNWLSKSNKPSGIWKAFSVTIWITMPRSLQRLPI